MTARTKYRVCDRTLDAETNEHCEFDGLVDIAKDGSWRCPSCLSARRSA